ncbi:hypothetical protein PoB_005093000 [Plakobranchus ocellatus]|uniref:Uncharacterized protein n=1 Tax=Plakobranchus ocellatus TaxID=259542 RepID=A0AAV4BYN2_9GAST|nr:hypothetical protein PoB_005093000 [Plakobranchus ocellatus]
MASFEAPASLEMTRAWQMVAEVSAQSTAWEKRWLPEEPAHTVFTHCHRYSKSMQRLIRVLCFAQEAETKKGMIC